MPFTVTHAVAVPLLRKLLGRFGVVSALVIGSAVPDLPCFLPLHVSRAVSHSELGLLYYAIPLELACYVLFHTVLRAPLIELLRDAIQLRIALEASGNSLPRARWEAVVASFALGAASHLLWDAFTHGGTYVVRAWPVLERSLFELGGSRVYVYSLLQHMSTLSGIVVLLLWLRRWMRRSPILAAKVPGVSGGRRVAVLLVAMGVMLASIAHAIHLIPAHVRETASPLGLLANAEIDGLRGFGVAIVVYAALWQIVRTSGAEGAPRVRTAEFARLRQKQPLRSHA